MQIFIIYTKLRILYPASPLGIPSDIHTKPTAFDDIQLEVVPESIPNLGSSIQLTVFIR